MKVFAHRGASGLAPENTIAAIELALSYPIDGVEIDVYPLEDDYIIIHDRWLTRTAGLNKRLDQISLNEARSTQVGSYQGIPQFIPLLSEVLALNWGNKLLNIELKSLHCPKHFLAYLDKHVNATKQLEPQDIVISAFNHHYLSAVRQHTALYPLGWLTASNDLTYAQQAKQQHSNSINIDMDVVNKAIVDDAHQRGLQVNIFTVDELADIDLLLDYKVDGVFTNRPDVISKYLSQD